MAGILGEVMGPRASLRSLFVVVAIVAILTAICITWFEHLPVKKQRFTWEALDESRPRPVLIHICYNYTGSDFRLTPMFMSTPVQRLLRKNGVLLLEYADRQPTSDPQLRKIYTGTNFPVLIFSSDGSDSSFIVVADDTTSDSQFLEKMEEFLRGDE